MTGVIIGMDPHKRSVTIEVMAPDESVLGGGRYGTDRARLRRAATRHEAVARPGLGRRGVQRHRTPRRHSADR